MNITRSIANRIGGEYEDLISENQEIQFYASSTTETYFWRDSRFPETESIWDNKKCDTRREVMKDFIKHIENRCKMIVRDMSFFNAHTTYVFDNGLNTEVESMAIFDSPFWWFQNRYKATSVRCRIK